MEKDSLSEQLKDWNPVFNRIERISQEEYDQLPEEEQDEYRVECPEIVEAVKNVLKTREDFVVDIMHVPEVDWIVEGFVVREGITLVYGEKGVGKTSLVLQLINSIIQGDPFLDIEVKPVKYLLVEQDENPSIMRSHVEKMSDELPGLELLQIADKPLAWNNATMDFFDNSLEQAIVYCGIDMVIIDSLTSLGIADINHPSCGNVLDRLRQVARDQHCAFIVLHHPNQQGTIMGSNMIPPKVEVILHVERNKIQWEKLRGDAPNGTSVGLGGEQYIPVAQDPKTLTFSRVQERDEWIWGLYCDGMGPKDIEETISPVYPTKANNVSQIIDRLKKKYGR